MGGICPRGHRNPSETRGRRESQWQGQRGAIFALRDVNSAVAINAAPFRPLIAPEMQPDSLRFLYDDWPSEGGTAEWLSAKENPAAE
jgi:hypothetical protein